jgi:chromosome segregation ATPase
MNPIARLGMVLLLGCGAGCGEFSSRHRLPRAASDEAPQVPRESPSDASAYLEGPEDIPEIKSQLRATVAKLDDLDEQIRSAELALATARWRQVAVLEAIDALCVAVPTLLQELRDLEEQYESAQQAHAELALQHAQRLDAARQRAAVLADQQYQAHVAQARQERQARDALRAQIGALPSGQAEAHLLSRRTDAARVLAQATYEAHVAAMVQRCRAEQSEAAAQVLVLQRRREALSARRQAVEDALNQHRDELRAVRAELALIAVRLAQLDEHSRQLRAKADILWTALRRAREVRNTSYAAPPEPGAQPAYGAPPGS